MAVDSTNNSMNIFSTIALQQNLRDNAANTALSSGITLMQKKKYEEAARAFKQASSLKPELTEAYTFLGDAYTRLGKKKEAIATYTLSLQIDRTQDALYTNIANLNIDLGNTSEAEKAFKAGIKQNSLNTLAYYTLGLLETDQGKYTDAEGRFRKVIQLEPRDGNGYYALGKALNGQGRYDEAITSLEKATTLKRDFVPAITELGKAYAGKGDLDMVNELIDRLDSIATSDAILSSQELTDQITKPGISYFNATNSSLNLFMPLPTSLLAIDPETFITPDASSDVTVRFVFDSDMDPTSVMNIANWSISRASGGSGGLYSNGLYSPTNVATPSLPRQVSYDPLTREAKLSFSLTQNSTGDGTIDPSHLIFKFKGVDSSGKSMNPLADEFSGFALTPF